MLRNILNKKEKQIIKSGVIKTVTPDNMVSFEEWCKTFKVSSLYQREISLNEDNKEAIRLQQKN